MSQPSAYTDFHKALQNTKSLFITAHVSPDGDALGAMLGLAHSLPNAFPQLAPIDCVISGKQPLMYHFMPGMERVVSQESAPHLLPHYDMAISVDCGAASRLGPALPVFQAAGVSVNIDHHVSNEAFGSINILETTAASSTQVVSNILNAWGVPISPEAATCLYVGLLTDTGGFRHSCTSPDVFRLAAQLQEAGCNTSQTYHNLFESLPRSQTLLHAAALLESRLLLEGRLIVATVSQAQLAQHAALEEQCEGLIDRLRETKGVDVAAFVRETQEGGSKISLRSNSDAYDVSAFLEQHFNGGGHKKAAGANVATPMGELIPSLEALLSGLLLKQSQAALS